MLEIRHRAGGSVNVLEDELRAISLSIEPEGLGIAPRRLDIAGGQHVDGSGNTPKERTTSHRCPTSQSRE